MKFVENFNEKTPLQRVMTILGMVFLLFYFTLGVLFLFFGDKMPFDLSPVLKKIFGLLLIAYSAFRFYRLVKSDS